MMTLEKHLPGHLRGVIGAVVGPLRATEGLLDCAQCTAALAGPTSGPYRHPQLKCCDYWPIAPNFLVGRWLESARATMLRLFLDRQYILPLGLLPPPGYQKLRESHAAPFLEFDSRVLCPMYNQKLRTCTVWSGRPSECATYFCRSEQAANGLQFWRAVRDLGSVIEQGLAQFAMLELGYDWSEVETQLKILHAAGEQWSIDQGVFHQLWAHHAHDPLGFFARADRWHQGLSILQIIDLIGSGEIEKRTRAIFAAYQLTSWGP